MGRHSEAELDRKFAVEVVPVDYKYSIGNQGSKVGDNKNDVQEYIFVGY